MADAVPVNAKVNPGIKQIYATTHTIDEAMYSGEWADALEGYAARDPWYLNACKTKVCDC